MTSQKKHSEEQIAQREQELINALSHIQKVASTSRTSTRRLRWIEQRAQYAIEGKPYIQDEFDMPKTSESVDSLKIDIKLLKKKIEELFIETENDNGYDYIKNEIINSISYLTISCPECESIIYDDDQYVCCTCEGGSKIRVLSWIKDQLKTI